MTLLAAVLAIAAPVHHADGCDRPYCEYRRRIVAPYAAKLNRVAWCESRRRWHINTGNGYYGALQFDLPTWRSVGGHRYPHQQNPLNQLYRAVLLVRRRGGYSAWPVCGSS